MSLIEIIKQAALDAIHHYRPCDVFVGTVVNLAPLEIETDSSIIVKEVFLVLSATVSGALKLGDNVIMMRRQGGQRYFIMDWVG